MLTTTRDAILPQLFSGQIPVSKAEREAECHA